MNVATSNDLALRFPMPPNFALPPSCLSGGAPPHAALLSHPGELCSFFILLDFDYFFVYWLKQFVIL